MRATAVSTLNVSSKAFGHKEHIPYPYSCTGANINPPLQIQNIPMGTMSLAIIVNDPDAPRGSFIHWVAWNIKPDSIIKENCKNIGIEGINDFGKIGYMGPCPPNGIHRYYFKIYALDGNLQINQFSRANTLISAMEDMVIGYGELVGLYGKAD